MPRSNRHNNIYIYIYTLSYQYSLSHCRDKTVIQSSVIHNSISYAGKMAYLYWNLQLFFKASHTTLSLIDYAWGQLYYYGWFYCFRWNVFYCQQLTKWKKYTRNWLAIVQFGSLLTRSGPHFNILNVFPSERILMMQISWDHLIFMMGPHILVRQHLYIINPYDRNSNESLPEPMLRHLHVTVQPQLAKTMVYTIWHPYLACM